MIETVPMKVFSLRIEGFAIPRCGIPNKKCIDVMDLVLGCAVLPHQVLTSGSNVDLVQRCE